MLFRPLVKLHYPEFECHFKINETLGWTLAYSFENIDGKDWFLEFFDRLILARDNKQYLPLYRMGDGEYTFLLGKNIYNITPFKNLSWKQKLLKLKLMLNSSKGHVSGTSGDGKESYTNEELASIKQKFIGDLRFVAKNGILGLGLDNGKFYGKYMPYIKEAFDQHNIVLNRKNYYHVYHVYALFGSSYGREFLKDQNLLIITSLTIDKRQKFEKHLISLGVKSVSFYSISSDKAMLDVLELKKIGSNVDIALIGAGVGSVNILKQLEPLSIPCLDIGTVLGNMLIPDRIYDRPYMANDENFDIQKIKFINADQRNKILNNL